MKSLFFLVLLILFINTTYSQLDKILKKISETENFKIDPPISTSIKDAYPQALFLKNLDQEINPDTLQRYSQDLASGYYRFRFKTFCLKTGTYASGNNDGFLPAPMKGKKAELIQNVLKRYIEHQEIDQNDVQKLIWGIESGMKFSKYPQDFQIRIKPLLTEEEIAEMEIDLYDIAKDLVPLLPKEVKDLLKLYKDINDKLSSASSKYEDIEKIAVKQGTPTKGKGSVNVERGTWAIMGNGVYMRCLPQGYRNTIVEEYIPVKVVVSKDSKNRIVSMDNGTNKIEITYDDSEGSDNFNGLPVWRYKTIQVSGSANFTKNDIGWYIPSGVKVSQNSSYKRIDDASTPEYKARTEAVNNFILLVKKTLGSKKQKELKESDLNEIRDMKNFEISLRFIIGMDNETDQWFKYDYPLSVNALYNFTSELVRGKIKGGGEKSSEPISSITSLVFVPGNTGLQRLGTIGEGGPPPNTENENNEESPIHHNQNSDIDVILHQVTITDMLPEPNSVYTAELEIHSSKQVQEIVFYLYDISRENGRCLNDKDPRFYKTLPDPDFIFDPSMNPDYEISSALGGFKARSSGSAARNIIAQSQDYGGFAKLNAKVKIDGNWYAARCEGWDKEYIKIPYDMNDNNVADKWEDDNLVTGFPTNYDEDNMPFGQKTSGDGITLYEEYRGFFELLPDGSTAHTRLDPNKKELFVIDEDNLISTYTWEQASGIPLYRLNRNLVYGTLAGGDMVHTRDYRLVDFCRGFSAGKKYAVNLVKVNGLDDPYNLCPDSLYYTGCSPLGPPINANLTIVLPDRIRKYLESIANALQIMYEAGPNETEFSFSTLGYGTLGYAHLTIDSATMHLYLRILNDPVKSNLLTDFITTMDAIHEVGHACGINHHSPVTGGDFFCPMRYTEYLDEFISFESLHPGIMHQLDDDSFIPIVADGRWHFCNSMDNCWGQIDVKDR